MKIFGKDLIKLKDVANLAILFIEIDNSPGVQFFFLLCFLLWLCRSVMWHFIWIELLALGKLQFMICRGSIHNFFFPPFHGYRHQARTRTVSQVQDHPILPKGKQTCGSQEEFCVERNVCDINNCARLYCVKMLLQDICLFTSGLFTKCLKYFYHLQ